VPSVPPIICSNKADKKQPPGADIYLTLQSPVAERINPKPNHITPIQGKKKNEERIEKLLNTKARNVFSELPTQKAPKKPTHTHTQCTYEWEINIKNNNFDFLTGTQKGGGAQAPSLLHSTYGIPRVWEHLYIFSPLSKSDKHSFIIHSHTHSTRI